MTGPEAAPAAPARQLFDRPVFIVSTPRSGSALLFETLALAPRLYTIGGESHWLVEDIAGLAPADRRWSSNRLAAEDAEAGRVEQLAAAFYRELKDRDGRPPGGPVRMLEKTPKNALRVPFFKAAFPDAMFVYLYRDVRETLASMIDAWTSGSFRTYPDLPGWRGHPWSLLLVPGWEQVVGQPLPVVVAHQWAATTNLLLDDLEALPGGSLRAALDYAEFLAEPQAAMESLAPALGLAWDRRLDGALPLSRTTLSQPAPDKWRRYEAAIEAMRPIVDPADARARAFLAKRRG